MPFSVYLSAVVWLQMKLILIEGPSPIKDPPLKIQIEDPPKSMIAIIQDPL